MHEAAGPLKYASCSLWNVVGHCQRALSVLPIQTDRPFDKALRVLHEMRGVRLENRPDNSFPAWLNDRTLRRCKDAVEMAREVADPADQWQRDICHIEADLDFFDVLLIEAHLDVVRRFVTPYPETGVARRLR